MWVKICGITNAQDADDATIAGAHAIGLNFYPASARCVSLSDAASIMGAVDGDVNWFAVCVHEVPRELESALRTRAIAMHVQLHKATNPPTQGEWMAAFAIRDVESLSIATDRLACWKEARRAPARVLVDAYVDGQHGGTGKTAPWELLAEYDPGIPLVLAGGLTAENVADAIRIVRPAGVDVAGGVECGPRKKDREKMIRFVANAMEASVKYPDYRNGSPI